MQTANYLDRARDSQDRIANRVATQRQELMERVCEALRFALDCG